jgi:hypothetical protein
MRQPLLVVAVGLVVVALYSRAGGFDLLPDPLGWALVLGALRTVVRRVELTQQTVLWVLGIGALLASAVLWWPSVHDWFADADPALGWAIDLPSLTFCAVLCHALSVQARAAGETFATGWLSWTAIGFAVSAVAPAIVIGGGVESLRDPAGIVTGLAQVSLFVQCVIYAGRAWAGAAESSRSADE